MAEISLNIQAGDIIIPVRMSRLQVQDGWRITSTPISPAGTIDVSGTVLRRGEFSHRNVIENVQSGSWMYLALQRGSWLPQVSDFIAAMNCNGVNDRCPSLEQLWEITEINTETAEVTFDCHPEQSIGKLPIDELTKLCGFRSPLGIYKRVTLAEGVPNATS